MKTLIQIPVFLIALLAFAALPSPTHAAGSVINVNSLLDNTTHGNGLCTLREAIANSNDNND